MEGMEGLNTFYGGGDGAQLAAFKASKQTQNYLPTDLRYGISLFSIYVFVTIICVNISHICNETIKMRRGPRRCLTPYEGCQGRLKIRLIAAMRSMNFS